MRPHFLLVVESKLNVYGYKPEVLDQSEEEGLGVLGSPLSAIPLAPGPWPLDFPPFDPF